MVDRLIPFQTVRIATDVARRIGEDLRPHQLRAGQTVTLEVYKDGDRLVFTGTTLVVDRDLARSTIRLPNGIIIRV